MITAEAIKNLRARTGCSIVECKKALEQAEGDETKALDFLSASSAELAAKKSERQIKAGLVDAYVHSNQKIGVLLELGCETDFVARNEIFKILAHELCLQISAMDPRNVDELLAQPFIKDPQRTIQDLIVEAVGKLGENIKVGRFIRFSI